jgi:iron complex outermembrane recepter protein
MTVIRPAIDAAVRAAVKSSRRPEQKLPKYLTTLWTAAFVLGMGTAVQAQQKPADETASQQVGAATKPADQTASQQVGGSTKPADQTASQQVGGSTKPADETAKQQVGGPTRPADETAGQQAGSPAVLEEITVTGSRIKRTNDFNTPTPTTVIDSSAMDSLGVVNLGQTLQLTPANASTFTPANTGNSPYFVGAYIPDLRGLNPYFGSRTLTLIDGQRFVQTAQGDQIDLNFIPQILVTRVDVVTGGASAAYGSGAIAGVENIILDSKLEGGKLDGDWSETSHSDGRDHHFGAAFGHGLFDDKVHFVIGGEIEHQDPVACDTRDWCNTNQGMYQTTALYPNAQYPSLNPLTTPLGVGSGLTQFTSPYGVFVNAAGKPYTVQGNTTGTGGVPYALVQPYASAATAFINTMPAGGQGIPLYQYNYLMPQVERGMVMTMLSGSIIDNLNWKASGYFGKVDNTKYLQTVGTTYDFLTSDNAYIQGVPSLQTAASNYALIPAGALYPGSLGYSPINKDWSSQVAEEAEFFTTVKRVTFGLDGKFGQSTWTWDANFEYGFTNRSQIQTNNLHNYAADMALDSVINPATGQPECRVTLDGFAGAVAANPLAAYAGANPLLAQGCVPVNPFGNQPLSAQQQAYMFGNLVEQLRYQQTDANINASGELFDGIGAGAFTAAVGYEFRREIGSNIDQPGVPTYIGTDYQTQYGQSFGGSVNVNEGYIELNAPLMKDQPGAHLLELDVAGRFSRYSNELAFTGVPAFEPYEGESFNHNLSTWKTSLIYEPVEGFRFRGSQSRDARAANFRELYYGQVISAGGSFGYCDPSGGRNDPCTWNLEGNPNLKPETSDTTTLGIVLTPTEWVSGLQFSADWFHIRINSAISAANPTIALDGCAAGIQADCNQLTFYNPGPNNNLGATANQSLATTPAEIAAAQAFYQGCFYQGNATCTRNLYQITPQSYNGAFYEVKGVDFSLQDTFDAGAAGTFTTRLLTTWMGEQIYANCTNGAAAGCYTYSILGQTGSGNGFLNDYTPDARWRGSLLVTWQQGPISITPSMNFVGHGTMDYEGITPAAGALYTEVLTGKMPNGQPISAALANYGYHPMPYNYVPSYFLFNLNGTYTFKDGPASGLQVFMQVNNVFNKQPPFADGGGGFGPTNLNGGTNPIFFDTLGLDWRLGFRYRF